MSGLRSDERPRRPTKMRCSGWAAIVVVTLLGGALACLIAEFAYRLTKVRGLGPTTHPSYVLHDAELGWKYRPLARERHTTSEFDVSIRINSQGFRGAEWPPATPDGRRILLLGDSVAFGWGVEEEETMARRIEALDPSWTVLNAAVAGYGTDQQLLLLRQLLPRVAPDLVIHVFWHNDLFENLSGVVYGRPKPRFSREGDRLEVRGQPVPRPWLAEVSLLYRALVKSWWTWRHEPRGRHGEAGWDMTRALIRAMRDELEGRPLVVVSGTDVLTRLAANEEAIFHVDTRPPLAGLGETAHFPIDGHWTPAAHEAIAAAVVDSLARIDVSGADRAP